MDLYTHWIKRSKRKTVLEVDRLMSQPEGDGCTFGCTPAVVNAEGLERKEKKWGEWVNDFRTFLIEKPDLKILEYVSG